jgi:hypothetical protein
VDGGNDLAIDSDAVTAECLLQKDGDRLFTPFVQVGLANLSPHVVKAGGTCWNTLEHLDQMPSVCGADRLTELIPLRRQLVGKVAAQ